MAQMPHKSSLYDFIESSLTLVVWIDFKFQIISEDVEIQSFNVNPAFSYATLSLPNYHDFFLACTAVALIFFFLIAITKVQTQNESIFGWK